MRLPIAANTSFMASARAGYSITNAPNSAANGDTSSTSYGATLGLVRERGATETVAAYLTSRAVRYDDNSSEEESSDFNVIDASLAYVNRTPRGDTSIGVGVSYLDQQEVDDDVGFFLQADASRRLTRLSRGGLRLNFGYNDQSNSALTAPLSVELGDDALDDITESSSTGPFYQRRAEAFLERVGRRSRLIGSLYLNSEDYVAESAEDELDYGATIAWSSQLSRFTELRISGTAEYRELTNQDEDSQNYTASVELTRRLSRNVSASFRLRHQLGTGSAEASEYDESALLFRILYEFGASSSQSAASYGEQLRSQMGDTPSSNARSGATPGLRE
jgi:hypothetical protein